MTTAPANPCVLQLDVPAAGRGGVDQFYVYAVGAGDEHVEFTGIEFSYVSWLDSPWAFGCNLDGPFCQSDGAITCDKPLVQEAFELGSGTPRMSSSTRPRPTSSRSRAGDRTWWPRRSTRPDDSGATWSRRAAPRGARGQ